MADSNSIDALREALQHSPENLPLRKHLGASLLSMGRTEEAAEVFRDGLAIKPESTELKVGLAGVFFSQGKYSHALGDRGRLARGQRSASGSPFASCKVAVAARRSGRSRDGVQSGG